MPEELTGQQIKELLEKNLQSTEEVKQEVAYIRRYMRLRTIITVIWIILVVAPAIFAIFYIPTMIKDITGDGDVYKLLGL